MVKKKRPIICMAAINWQYLFQRPQQLMMRFAKMGHPVFYRNPSQALGEQLEVFPNLWVYEDFRKVPEEAIETAIYFVYFPAWAGGIETGKDKFVIYDCADDFPEFTPYEDEMCQCSDLVICCSETLMDKLKNKHERMLFLPNGADLEHFAIQRPIPPPMAEIREKGEAIIGFSGAMYHQRVDVELLYYLARNRPQWQIVIVGETYQWDFSGAPNNINNLGNQSYNTLPSYISNFDVGLIPFHDNQIARGTDPIKLYEYLASGIPIISRDLPFLKHPDLPPISAYRNHQECLYLIEQVLAEEKIVGEENRRIRMDYVSKNSWDQRVSQLLANINEITWIEN